jgi:Fic family protein
MPGSGLPRRLRQPCRYSAYVPDLLADIDLALPGDVMADVSDAEQAILRLNTRAPVLASLEAVARFLLRAEAVASSRIEGLTLNVRRLVEAEAAQAIGVPVRDATAESVLGNVVALRLAVEDISARPTVSVDDLLRIHHALMEHTDRPEQGGRVRVEQNWIGGNDYNPCGAEFVPPPPDLVPELLEDLVAFVNIDRYPALVQAALAHVQFETIHPFADGNGRVGRALVHIVLRRRGLAPVFVPPISLVLATRAGEYVRGLQRFRYLGPPEAAEAQAGMAAYVEMFAAAAARAAADSERYGARLDELVDQWRTQAAPVRADSAADRLLRVLPSAPVVTIGTAAMLIGRTPEAARLAVDRLAQVGVLTPMRRTRRYRAFEAVGVLQAITDFERALASPTGDTRAVPPVRPVPARIRQQRVAAPRLKSVAQRAAPPPRVGA